MAVKTESKTIEDHEYSVTQWNVEKAMLNKFKLMKMFGASLTMMASAMPNEKNKEETNEVEVLSKSMALLFESSTPEEFVSMMKQCIVGVAKDGTRITESSFNMIFDTDDLLTIYKVFIFVLQVNYSNFLKGQLAEKLLARVNN